MNSTRTILFSVILAILTIALIILIIDRSDKQNDMETLKSQIAAMETNMDNENMILFRRNDDLFFEQNYQDALAGYLSMLDDSTYTIYEEQLANRVTFLRDYLQVNQAPQVNISDTVIVDSDEEEDQLTSLDSLPLIDVQKDEKKDSLERRITELNRKISTQERALKEKEQLRALTIKNDERNNIQYVGDTKDGKANGKGTGIWEASGGTYKGDWVDNKRHGYGVYIWKDGVRYEGDFRNDKREGKGSYFWTSGERYVGQWKDNRRNGEGILYDKDGNISYQGVWEDDKPKTK